MKARRELKDGLGANCDCDTNSWAFVVMTGLNDSKTRLYTVMMLHLDALESDVVRLQPSLINTCVRSRSGVLLELEDVSTLKQHFWSLHT